MEDHVTAFDPSPWVNYQGYRYMSRDGAMYLIVEDPDARDTLGNVIPLVNPLRPEGPPDLTPTGYRLVNAI